MKKIYIIGAILATLLIVGVVYADTIQCTVSGMTDMLSSDCAKHLAEGS